MSDTILSADFTVYYVTENRQKRIEWSGAATGTRTVKELYLALQDLFDGQTQMREGEPMKADTPTDFTIGQIDASDPDPWFIDQTSVEHLTGAILRTTGWARSTGTLTGIARVPITNITIVDGDIGQDITHADLDAGTLLDVSGAGANQELWIRPDSSAAGDDWDSTAGTITEQGTSHTATQTAASENGESLWSNPYTIASLATDTHVYIYQDGVLLTEYKDTGITAWWGRDHIDILILVKVVGGLIDEGFITTLARQYSKLDTYNIADLSAGVRFPIPLETAADIANTSGYKIITTGVHSGAFLIGEEIIGGTSTAKGILTAFVTDTSLSYYLLDDLTDFQSGEVITGQTSTETATSSGAPANAGPASLVGLSIAHANNNTEDIDENGTNEYYSIVLDFSDETIEDVWEWVKYEFRRGNTGAGNADGIPAEHYLGSDWRIAYTTLTLTVSEGDVVTQDNSGATGIVVAHHTTPKILVLRNSRGTFNNTDIIRVDGSNYVSGPTSIALTITKESPMGSFPGAAKWFMAPGVVPVNYQSGDANKFSLLDDEGNTLEAPVKVTVLIGATRIGDYVFVGRATSPTGPLEDEEYGVDATQPAAGSTMVVAATNISSDTPTAGRVVVYDISAGVEHVYRYTGWSVDTFTLFNITGLTLEGGSGPTTAFDTGAFANAKVGDVFRNTTRADWAYITEVTSNDEVQLSKSIASQQSGDNYEVGTTVQAYATEDFIWVPFILEYETSGTDGAPGQEDTLVAYASDVPVIIRARNATAGSYKIKNFFVRGTIGSGGYSTNVIRNPETVT